MKTDRIDTSQFNITSVQDDHSEINLSSGRISVDLLHKRAMSEDKGTFIVALKLFVYVVLNCFDKEKKKRKLFPVSCFRYWFGCCCFRCY